MEFFNGIGRNRTLDLRSLIKAALAAQLGLDEAALESQVFPDSRAVRPLEGLFV